METKSYRYSQWKNHEQDTATLIRRYVHRQLHGAPRDHTYQTEDECTGNSRRPPPPPTHHRHQLTATFPTDVLSKRDQRVENVSLVDHALVQARLNSSCQPLTVQIQELDELSVAAQVARRDRRK